MAKYVYISNPSRIKSFLNKIQSIGIPDKLTIKYLESLGFKKLNDRPLVSIMKVIGFVTLDGVPTDRWKNYRDKKKAGYILAEGIREHYAELYKTYNDAHLKDNQTLLNFFRAKTEVGERALSYMVSAFKALTDLADFKAEMPSPPPPEKESDITKLDDELLSKQIEKPGLVININIQLTLPETTNTATYDAFFNAMKKHLLS